MNTTEFLLGPVAKVFADYLRDDVGVDRSVWQEVQDCRCAKELREYLERFQGRVHNPYYDACINLLKHLEDAVSKN